MKYFIFVLLLTLSASAETTVVTYNAEDFTGQSNNLPVTLTSIQKVRVNNSTLITGKPVTFTPVNGTYTTNVWAGVYNLTIEGIPQGLMLVIPQNSNAVSLASCVVSNMGLFGVTNLTANILSPVFAIAGSGMHISTNGLIWTFSSDGGGGTASSVSGTLALGNAVSTGSVTGLGLTAAPIGITLQLVRPVNGLNLAAWPDDGTLTTDGFNFALSGVTDSTSYKLSYTIFLAGNTDSGTLALGSGVSSGSVTGKGLLTTPTGVTLQILRPNGALNISATLDDGTLTTDGFNFALSGLTDSTSYKLFYTFTH